MSRSACSPGIRFLTLLAGALLLACPARAQVRCTEAGTLRAEVAAIDMPLVFNRLGAQNVNWQMYALWRDLVHDSRDPSPLPPSGKYLDEAGEAARVPFAPLVGKVTLRPDLRPRPLTLRVAAGQCLRVRFINLLTPVSNPHQATDNEPFIGHPMNSRSHAPEANIDDQVASRIAGFHPQGLELVRGIEDDSSFAGTNATSLAAPGQFREYLFYAPHEGAFLVSNPGAVFGGEGTAGTAGTGLFGTVAVQPRQAKFYRAQLTEEELRLATRDDGKARTPQGQPVVDYEATYPDDCPSGVWCREGRVGLPILNMVKDREIVHGDINAVITGPLPDGSFPPDTYPLEGGRHRADGKGERNPTLPNRLEPFREFISVFHDENAAAQAFPGLFENSCEVTDAHGAGKPDPCDDNPLQHTLHGVRDAFMINYGSGGVGAEVVANRLRVGPMHDCVDCAFEEFFLSSFAVGDPALLVDQPANLGLEGVRAQPLSGTAELDQAMFGLPADLDDLAHPEDLSGRLGPKATHAYYPQDPANVHHSYIGDFVKFRNVHMGKEQHVFHLHNHQWLFNPNDDNSNYIDAQAIGPGSGYTYEIAFGGSGNRNRSAGDAVFHCHYYPHFAQGMWYLWRVHDTFEAGTRLEASGDSFHDTPFGLWNGKPAPGARALPDGEIVAGTPIPAVVPLPGKALAPMPGKVEVVANPRTSPFTTPPHSKPIGSLARVEKVPDPTIPEIGWRPKANPGYPFWIAGIEDTVGSRPPTPPLDMDAVAGGWDGGLPRHAVAGYSAHSESEDTFHRLSAKKHEKKVRPVYFPEQGTGVERFAMDFHALPAHDSSAVLPDGSVSPAQFRTNGAPPTPGAPFFEPCVDDRQRPLDKDLNPKPQFHNGTLDNRPMVDRQQPGDPGGDGLFSFMGASAFDSRTPRLYKGANVQLDVTFNKLGYHFSQQRILALWEDVGPLLERKQPPEPLVLRMNTFDCARYLHTNLVPKDYEVDDYQISTPTDVIGQHIHLPKWDLPSADGSANGWNYEDGTFSPAMVRSRITAINRWNAGAASLGEAPVPLLDGSTAALVPRAHYFFNAGNWPGLQQADCEKVWQGLGEKAEEAFHNSAGGLGLPRKCDWLGARTTIQRWFNDPVVNARTEHRGLGITFTHDHLGPSTHQQVGLYATMLTEPPNAVWRHNETGNLLYDTASRQDGGPTSWQAVITGCTTHVDGDPLKPCSEYGRLATNAHMAPGDDVEDSHREFFLQFGDFQHAYLMGEAFGVDTDGVKKPPTSESFRAAINPSVRKPANPNFPDIYGFEPTCPGYVNSVPVPRPCPEMISADDVGMMVVNYRNEPVAARVYDKDRTASDGKDGTQAAFARGDLTHAYQSRTDRVIPVLNTVDGGHYPTDINAQRQPGDPYTPMLRALSGDLVRVKIQAGSHEHEHNGTVHGLKWLQSGSGYGAAPNSGWRNAQNAGLSEQFTLSAAIFDYEPPNHRHLTDRLWSIDTSQDGLWNGVWGVVRTYSRLDKDAELKDPGYQPVVEPLVRLPQNPIPTVLSTRIQRERPSTNDCGVGDGQKRVVRHYDVLAVLANQALGNPLGSVVFGFPGLRSDGGTLTYNHRRTEITLNVFDEDGGALLRTERYGLGPLHDPTAVMLVREEDYDFPNHRLKPGVPVEPIVLRASAGECVQVMLKNLLPRERFRTPMPDLNGFTSLGHVIRRDAGAGASSMTSFNNNLIRPSHQIGLHPQLLHYDASVYDGSVVGLNIDDLVAPGSERLYQWYAGGLELVNNDVRACVKEPDPDPVLADLNLLRPRARDGRLLRASTSLNTEWALGQRLLAFFDVIPPEERRTLETNQPGPTPDRPPQEPAFERPRALDLRLTRPDSTLRLLRQPGAAALPDARLIPTIRALLEVARTENCVEETAPDEEATRAAAVAVRRDLPLLAEMGPDFEVDGAPLLQRATVFERLLRNPQGEPASRFDLRRVCVRSVLPNAERVILSDPELVQTVGEARLREIARLWSLSFAFLVPELDRDVFDPSQAPAQFRWWRPAYPPLDNETTRIVTLGKACRFEGIEFGGSNLTPPDRIKQGQKGAVGAVVILPRNSAWAERAEDSALDHQDPGPGGDQRRPTRATATVGHIVEGPAGTLRLGGFRDFVAVHQKGQNLRYGKPLADGEPFGAVAVLAAEREGDESPLSRSAPEDAHDSGQMGINYGAEPMWFRFGIAPDAPFGHGGKAGPPLRLGEGLGGTRFAYQAFSDTCCTSDMTQPSGTATPAVGEPATPVFQTLVAGSQSRLRVLMPTGVGRGTVTHLHGHNWRRDPYLAGNVSGVASQCIGANPLAFWLGGQESITPMAHFDLVLDTSGGANAVAGDYLMRDQGGFGITNGLWALLRNRQSLRPGPLDNVLRRPLQASCF